MTENFSATRRQYNKRFEEILSKLNPSQRAAVDNIDGPVLTIAGPGTGKTHILAARIGQILIQTDTQPHNVLCLTYTDAGVNAMRRRLLEFIGPEAHRIHIFTFHSFCNKVIQENLDIFGYNELQLISDLERIDILRQIIDGLDPTHPIRINNRRSPYRFEGKLMNLFSRMKTEGWDAPFVSAQLDEYIASLPKNKEFCYKVNGKGYKKGELNLNKYKPEVQKMEELRAASFLFDEYEHLMHEAGRYDYDDMILWVMRAFANPENEHVLRRYQEQYLYILVDEFQDTNGAQSKILHSLIEYWEEPNIFIVGDDDQSIFEFQGARVKNMIDFFHRYEQYLTLVILKENYRSGQAILDAAKQVIDQNEIRIIRQLESLDVDKDLVAASLDLDHSNIELHVREYTNRVQEEVDIIQQIKVLQESGIPLNEIGIVYAKHKQAADFIRMLERHDIPYQTKRQIDILELPLIQNLLHLLTYIAKEFEKPYSGEEYVYELLHFSFLGILPRDVALLTAYLAKTNRKKHDKGDYDYLQWRDLLRNSKQLKKIGLESPNTIIALSDFIDDAIWAAVNNPLPEVIERVFNRSGLIAYITQSPDKPWFVEVATTFFDFVRRETERNQGLNIWGLLELINRMKANRLELGVSKSSYAEDGVNLMTAHGAKGLEYTYVFMLHCLKDFWEPSNRQNPRQFSFPENLMQSSADIDAMEASRRLFYVAMTRAKTFLQLSYHRIDHNQKETTRTEFLDNLVIDMGLEVEFRQVKQDKVQAEQMLFLEEKELPVSAQLDNATIAALLEGFRLSVSSLNAYLDCPRSFYFQKVLKIPSTSSVEALYGDAVHNALKRVFDQAERSPKKRIPPITELQEAFKQEMIKRRIQFSEKAYEDAFALGTEHLPRYYAQRIKLFNEQVAGGVWTEKPFRNVQYKGVPLTGIIDKVVFSKSANGDRFLHVVDYKTGRLDNKRFKEPHTRNTLGGNYYRQLVFYKIMLDASGLAPHPVKTAEIDYLSPNEQEIFPAKKMDIRPDNVAHVGELIVNTYKNIMEHNFSEGCGKAYCKWCNFVKKQKMPESFRDEELELLDD